MAVIDGRPNALTDTLTNSIVLFGHDVNLKSDDTFDLIILLAFFFFFFNKCTVKKKIFF